MEHKKNYILLFIMSIIWGLNIVLMKILSKSLTVAFISTYRVIIAFLILLFLIKNKDKRLLKKQHLTLFLIAFINISLYMYLSNTAILLADSKNIAFITALSPMITTLLTIVIMKKKPSKYLVSSVICGFIGSAIIYIGNGIANLQNGDFLMLAAVFVHCLSYILIEKYSKDIDSMVLITHLFFYGAIQLLTFNLFFHFEDVFNFNIEINTLLLFLLSSVVGYSVCQIIYQYSITTIGSIKTSLFLNINPLFTLIGAYFILNETIQIHEIIGFIIILLGISIITKEKK